LSSNTLPKKDIFTKFSQDGLKFYLKYLENNKYILRFHNMFDNKNITLNLDKLNLTEVSLTGVFTIN